MKYYDDINSHPTTKINEYNKQFGDANMTLLNGSAWSSIHNQAPLNECAYNNIEIDLFKRIKTN